MLSILNVRANHHNSCEYSFHVEENENHVWGIVADGCSSGIKSHFASQLIAYFIQNEVDPRCTSDYTIRRLKDFLYNMRITLQFSEMNLLSTCLLFTYNKSN